jgi:citrate lyase beta subunit
MALTTKDRADAAFLLTQDLDYLCLSFVQDEADVRQLRAMMADSGRVAGALPKIIVKVEKPAALLNIDGILVEADGLMVARGDRARACPAGPEDPGAPLRRCRQDLHRRDADAEVDDAGGDAHARGGLRRLQRVEERF